VGGSHGSPKRTARPSPRGSTGASRLGEAHGESSRRIWSSVTRTLTVIPLPEGGGGPSKLPGDLRRGPVHPARHDWSREWPREPKLGGVSEETGCGGGYASTGVERVWLGSEPAPKSRGLSGCASVARQRQVHVGALRGRPRRVRRSDAGEASCVSRHCRSRPVRNGLRGRIAFDKRTRPSGPVFQRRTNRRSARLKARTRRGQAALPIAAGAWEARRATGYG
jgi:hypothetical protein